MKNVFNLPKESFLFKEASFTILGYEVIAF